MWCYSKILKISCVVCRFRKFAVVLTKGCRALWQPSSLTLLTLWARASFIFLLTAFPNLYSNGPAQPSVYSVSLRSFCNSCNASTITSLIGRNLFFYPAKFIYLLGHFHKSWECVSSQSEASRTGGLFATSR